VERNEGNAEGYEPHFQGFFRGRHEEQYRSAYFLLQIFFNLRVFIKE